LGDYPKEQGKDERSEPGTLFSDSSETSLTRWLRSSYWGSCPDGDQGWFCLTFSRWKNFACHITKSTNDLSDDVKELRKLLRSDDSPWTVDEKRSLGTLNHILSDVGEQCLSLGGE